MQIVEARADVKVFDADGGPAYELREGRRYVLYDHEAGRALRDGAVHTVTSLDQVLPAYRGEPLVSHRLLLPFIGGLGDAIVTASCLSALRERRPNITVDIAAREHVRALLELFAPYGQLLAYPVEADAARNYDLHLSFEPIEAVPDGGRRSAADVFSACLHTPRPVRPARLYLPLSVRSRWVLPPGVGPRVAIHHGRPASLRTYPREYCDELTQRLLADGCEVFWIGVCPSTPTSTHCPPSGVRDLVNRTTAPADLAAVLRQMDVLVTGDSFPMHLAGILEVPTIAVFTATDPVIASDYRSVAALKSAAVCSPCRISEGPCPLGYPQCAAFHDSSVSCAALHDAVRNKLAAALAK